MGWPLGVGVVLFFVPAFIAVLLCALASDRRKGWTRLCSIIAGDDNRLSLSRLQAFLWTMVVFGAYLAVWAISDQVSLTTWPQIPRELLELTGIAIASGVFSSLIAGQHGEAKTVVVSRVTLTSAKLTITGSDFGTRGTIQIESMRLLSTRWEDTVVEVGLPDGAKPADWFGADAKKRRRLVVDCDNGKAGYWLEPDPATAGGFVVADEAMYYEFSDLFESDTDPATLSLMKVQMFGWTAIAIVTYVFFFLGNLDPSLTGLPTVDPSLVILTGASQAGYITGKGVPSTSAKQ